VKKRTASSTKSKTAWTPLGIEFDKLLPPPEIWNHMRDCEARHWVKRFNEIKAESGSIAAREWWQKTSQDIEKRRGAEALADLKLRMNKVK
jgi:hypothetical protein